MSHPPQPPGDPIPPDPLRFEEGEVLGEGGMSTIVRAFDRVLLRDTAHKVLRARYTGSPRHQDRFTTEARLTGQLEHPNIVPVHAMGRTPDGAAYFNMKRVEGLTLEARIAQAGEGRLHPDHLADTVQILLKVCHALAFAHSRGVVHRDIKPANIMVGPFGEVYLMDWGVALVQPGSPIRLDPDAASAEDITGTPAYMPPEQVLGEPVDPRADVFALGATLYHALTGQPPYPGPTALAALTQAAEAAWTPLDPARTPPGIGAIVARAMQRRPADRYPSVRELRRDLERWLRGRWHLPVRAHGPGEVVLREGDHGDEAFLIVAGHCQATTRVGQTETVLSQMGPGDVFGEMAIFSNRPRSSTVVALTPLQLQVVTRTTLAAATGLDGWVGTFITALADRFQQAEARLLAHEARVNTSRSGADSEGA